MVEKTMKIFINFKAKKISKKKCKSILENNIFHFKVRKIAEKHQVK